MTRTDANLLNRLGFRRWRSGTGPVGLCHPATLRLHWIGGERNLIGTLALPIRQESEGKAAGTLEFRNGEPLITYQEVRRTQAPARFEGEG